MRQIFANIPFSEQRLLALAQRFAQEKGTLLLYSAGKHPCAEKSFLALFPIDYKTSSKASCWEELETLPLNGDDFPLWFGYLSYEMGSYSDTDKPMPPKQLILPHFEFYRYAFVLIYAHATQTATFIFEDSPRYQNVDHSLPPHPYASDTEESYVQKIEEIKEEILNGNVYQVNLSQQFSFKGKLDSFALFLKLTQAHTAPFAAFFNTNHITIVSTSPERLLMKKGSLLEARPIKGTMPRGQTEAQDQELKQKLLKSPKECAELMMITDLIRNDLTKVSEIGSVHVVEARCLEVYESVFHTVSIVRSTALQNLSSVSILRALFPGGSITGCPKLSAMALIAQLEQRPRGIYTGSIGYFCGNGGFDFNIAIRTVQIRGEAIDVQVGGGIVVDSDSKKEYEETIHKGKRIFCLLQEVLNGGTFTTYPASTQGAATRNWNVR